MGQVSKPLKSTPTGVRNEIKPPWTTAVQPPELTPLFWGRCQGSVFGLKKRRIQNRPEVNKPAEPDNPKNRSQTKLDDGHEQAALKQLPQAGDEKAAQCGDDVSG